MNGCLENVEEAGRDEIPLKLVGALGDESC